jgi:hypothetical protein
MLELGDYFKLTNLKHSGKLQEAFRSYRRGEILPGSFWKGRNKKK